MLFIYLFCYLLELTLVRIYGGMVLVTKFTDPSVNQTEYVVSGPGSGDIVEVEELASVLVSLDAICPMSLLNFVSLHSFQRVFSG